MVKIVRIASLALAIAACSPDGGATNASNATSANSTAVSIGQNDQPPMDAGGESVSPYTVAQVAELKRRADSGDIAAARDLWTHYSFEQDQRNVDIQIQRLIRARHPNGLMHLAAQISDHAYDLPDSDPAKLRDFQSVVALRREARPWRDREPTPGDIALDQEIARLQRLHSR